MFNFGPVSSFQKPSLSAVAAYLATFKPGYKAKACQEKLDNMFKVGKEVRDWEGRVYKVFDVQLGSALLLDAGDVVHMVTWISDLGQLRMDIADDWNLVEPAQARPVAVNNWELLDAEAAHA